MQHVMFLVIVADMDLATQMKNTGISGNQFI